MLHPEVIMQTQTSYEQLAFDVEELRANRDKMTKALQDLLALIDDSDIMERYPAIIDAADRCEVLL